MASRNKSHRGELTARIAEIPLLLAERPRTATELAKHFGVDVKTIRRCIDALSLRYHITEERGEDRHLYYRYRDGYKFVPPPLTPPELAILLLAQESIATTGLTAFGSPFAAYARSLLGKVRSSLPGALRDRLDALSKVYGSAAVPAKDFAPHAETIDLLTTAVLESRAVRLNYYTLNRDAVEERTVEPYAVYFDPDGATLKLICFDHNRRAIIPLSVDHIRSINLTTANFTRPADFDLHRYLSEHCFNGIHGDPINVKLRAHGVTARIFAERTFHPSQRIIEQTPATDDQVETITIEMRVAQGRGLVRFILSWAPDVEVLDPSTLKDEVSAAHRLALARLTAKVKHPEVAVD